MRCVKTFKTANIRRLRMEMTSREVHFRSEPKDGLRGHNVQFASKHTLQFSNPVAVNSGLSSP
ncbi:hypothetical protein Mapa_006552 [Marchantia paleacea]|nr:hypothetical protein Mapa_006552 [Marchantia paleacea]